MDTVLVSSPVSVPFERSAAGGVVAQYGGENLGHLLKRTKFGGLPVVRKSSVRKSIVIPHIGPIGLTLHKRGFKGLHRV